MEYPEADVASLGAKLDELDLTDAESAALMAVFDAACDPDDEVAGFGLPHEHQNPYSARVGSICSATRQMRCSGSAPKAPAGSARPRRTSGSEAGRWRLPLSGGGQVAVGHVEIGEGQQVDARDGFDEVADDVGQVFPGDRTRFGEAHGVDRESTASANAARSRPRWPRAANATAAATGWVAPLR